MSGVVAVITGAAAAQEQACRDALAAQEVPVAEVLTGPDALARAAAGDHDRVWILEGGAAPGPDALSGLLGLADGALRCGMVVDPAGRPLAFALPSGDTHDVDAVIALAVERVLPIRRATLAHTLVPRAALREHGLPDPRYGAYAGDEWTARVAARGGGRFLPASVAVLPAAPPPPRAIGPALRTARTPTWTNGERIAVFAALLRR
ncbi:hypothetical protein LRS13_05790 [Svornostia abyssi]|uniref:Uncharacterized protein n=1 Tax=Svornostia abyssi TaxID=2898438 RepID=A0ABY5PKE7_9ACTN|nr:hypothetical protein LRS13_05790 [Parviterribacteraceae bacterium J379]